MLHVHSIHLLLVGLDLFMYQNSGNPEGNLSVLFKKNIN